MSDAKQAEGASTDTFFVEAILKEISDIVSSIDDAQQVMDRLVSLACMMLGVRTCSLVLVNLETQEMRIRAAHGLGEEVMRRFRQRVGEGITGHVAETGKPLLIENVETHPLFRRKNRNRYQTKSLLSVPLIHNNETIGVLNVNNRTDGLVFKRSDELLLSILANLVVIALDKAKMRETAIKFERYEAELRVAQHIQECMLPRSVPEQEHWEIAVRNVPAHAVAGDFFDLIPLPDGRTCVVIGDVCGKGVPAALYMARVLGYFRVAAKIQGEADKIMSFVNELLAGEWTEQTFVTATVCVLGKDGRKMSICSAGHPKPYRMKAGAPEAQALGVQGDLPLGIESGVPFAAVEIAAAPGDVFVFYTDGVTDAKNPEGNILGIEPLKDAISRNASSVETLADAIVSEAEAFAEGQTRADDITLLVIKRT